MKLTQKEQNKLNKQLFQAVGNNDLASVKAAVAAGANINAHNRYSYNDTPLIKSAHYSINIRIMQFLLEHGADPNYQNEYGNTALHDCIFLKDIPKVKLLLDYNADMYIKNKQGQTPFTEALLWNKYPIAELYVLNGYIPTEEDFDSISDTDKRTEVKAQFMELAQQVQSHKAKLEEATGTDQEVRCCGEIFDF